MGMFSNGKAAAAIDFAKWEAEGRGIRLSFDRQLAAIVAADTEYQDEKSKRGGSMTSSPTDEAETAASQVRRRRDDAVAAFVREKSAVLEPEHRRLAADALAAVIDAAAKMSALAVFEDNTSLLRQRLGLPAEPCVADRDLHLRAHEFDGRVARLTASPVVTRRASLLPVPTPDFQALTR